VVRSEEIELSFPEFRIRSSQEIYLQTRMKSTVHQSAIKDSKESYNYEDFFLQLKSKVRIHSSRLLWLALVLQENPAGDEQKEHGDIAVSI